MIKILLAEDDAVMREYLTRALEKSGYSVSAVDCGTAALPLLEQDTFDLLLTDIVMPEMDGIELAQKASEMVPDLRVMFITGFAAVTLKAQDILGIIENGTYRVLKGPLNYKEGSGRVTADPNNLRTLLSSGKIARNRIGAAVLLLNTSFAGPALADAAFLQRFEGRFNGGGTIQPIEQVEAEPEFVPEARQRPGAEPTAESVFGTKD